MLDNLIGSNRIAELDAGLAVFQRHFVHRFHRADRFSGGCRDARFNDTLDQGQSLADLAQNIRIADRNVR